MTAFTLYSNKVALSADMHIIILLVSPAGLKCSVFFKLLEVV
jgi:hypothetical protein